MPAIDFKFDKRINGVYILDRGSVREQLKPLAEKKANKRYVSQIHPQSLHEPVYIPDLDVIFIETYFPLQNPNDNIYKFEYPIKSPNLLFGHGYDRTKWKFSTGTLVQDIVDKLQDAEQEIHCLCSCNPGGLHLKNQNILYPLETTEQGVYFIYDLKGDELTIETTFSANPSYGGNRFHVPIDAIVELLTHPKKYSTLENSRRKEFKRNQNFLEKVSSHNKIPFSKKQYVSKPYTQEDINWMKDALRYFVENNCDISLSEVEERLQKREVKEKLLGK